MALNEEQLRATILEIFPKTKEEFFEWITEETPEEELNKPSRFSEEENSQIYEFLDRELSISRITCKAQKEV